MLCLFEDHLAENFYPVALTRHVSRLLVGTMTLGDRAVAASGDRSVTLHGRSHIRRHHGAIGAVVARPSEETLFLNARLLATPDLMAMLPAGREWVAMKGEAVVAARLSADRVARLDWEAESLAFPLHELPRHTIDEAVLYGYLWDLIGDNGTRIEEDFSAYGSESHGIVLSGAHVTNRERLALAEGAVIKPGAVIDTDAGPVILGRNVEVMPNAVIEGPCWIGEGSRIKIGAKIYGQTSIGPRCKVGGEVENTIILGYSNKQHDGFVGHSYLGAWVNLGADTNTSDLKNNYGRIRVALAGREIDTGRMFLGSLIGDHAKTGINTMLNTGTVIGVAANVFGGGYPPKEIASFAWGGHDRERFQIERAIELARTVHGRRGVPFTDADAELLHRIWDDSNGTII